MKFKLTGTMNRVLWKNDSGTSFLVSIQEAEVNPKTSETHTKTWSIFTKQELFVGAQYDIEGYVSEIPNKGFVNEQGKVAYKANFNATKCEDCTAFEINHDTPTPDMGEIPF